MDFRTVMAQNALLTSRIDALERLVMTGGVSLGMGPSTDPPPDGGGLGGGRGGLGGPIGGGLGGGIGPIGDPSPDELGRLSKVQLQSRLAEIDFFRNKLDALEGMLKEAVQGR